jgi:hypothetical protein
MPLSNRSGPRANRPGRGWGPYPYGAEPGWYGCWGPGYAWGPPWAFPQGGWGPMGWGAPGPWGPPSWEEEVGWLKEYAETLKEELNAVQQRIEELAAEQES